jgi:hypothetical protein
MGKMGENVHWFFLRATFYFKWNFSRLFNYIFLFPFIVYGTLETRRDKIEGTSRTHQEKQVEI